MCNNMRLTTGNIAINAIAQGMNGVTFSFMGTIFIKKTYAMGELQQTNISEQIPSGYAS